jgi:hypothetical protein
MMEITLSRGFSSLLLSFAPLGAHEGTHRKAFLAETPTVRSSNELDM